jgi:hypothetical protein
LTVGGGAATAIASAPDAGGPSKGGAPVAKTMLEASVEVPQTRDRYRQVYGEAEKLDIAPKRNLAKSDSAAPSELHSEAFIIRAGVTGEKALRKAKEHRERARERRRGDRAASLALLDSLVDVHGHRLPPPCVGRKAPQPARRGSAAPAWGAARLWSPRRGCVGSGGSVRGVRRGCPSQLTNT